jgi:hypothetical protein
LHYTVRHIVSARATLHARLSARADVPQPYLAMATETLEFAKSRGTLPRNPVRRAGTVLRHASAGRYNRFSYEPWADMVRDILNR